MSAVNVYVRGLPQMYDLVIFLLWIGTPVFYPMSIVPEPVRTVLMYSPMYFVVTAIRSAVTDPAPLDTGALLGAMAAGLCSLAIGVLAFRALRRAPGGGRVNEAIVLDGVTLERPAIGAPSGFNPFRRVPQTTVLRGIDLRVAAGAKLGVVGCQRRRQVDIAALSLRASSNQRPVTLP